MKKSVRVKTIAERRVGANERKVAAKVTATKVGAAKAATERKLTGPTLAADYVRKAKKRDLTIGIMGLGYVGLPLAEAFLNAGFRVLGFDIDDAKIEALKAGRTYIEHIPNKRIAAMNATKRFEVTSTEKRLAAADALLMCVPTPLNAHREPDISYVERTTELIAKRLRPGQLVVLESTTYPGTSDEVVKVDPREDRPQGRPRLRHRLLARARGPRQHQLLDLDHSESRRSQHGA